MDSIGGFVSTLGAAFRDFLQTIFGAISGFIAQISAFTSNIYYYIPKPYVIGGLTILALGVILMLTVGRPRR